MTRATLKVSAETAARLRATMPGLSAAAGRMLTIDGALNELITTWEAGSWAYQSRRLDGSLPASGTGDGPA